MKAITKKATITTERGTVVNVESILNVREQPSLDSPVNDTLDNGSIVNIDINLIKPNKYQPRTDFDKEGLLDLANSIKTHGIIQPIIVRKIDDNY